jgi:hypothetical protein
MVVLLDDAIILGVIKNKNQLKKSQKTEGQRSNERLGIKPGASVVVKKSFLFGFGTSRIIHSAAIIDISLNGMRVEYKAPTIWSFAFDKLSIKTHNHAFLIEDIPCHIISDTMRYRLPKRGCVRRCGIQFGRLSYLQRKQMSIFIREYAVEPNPPSSWHVAFY